MRLGATSLSATKPGAVRKYAAAGGGSSSTLPDIDTYSHVRFDKININNFCNAYAVGISPDGTKLYTLWREGNYSWPFQQQTLSTAFDISSHGTVTASFDAQDDWYPTSNSPYAFRFVDNGSKLYFARYDRQVKQYDLSTPWDMTSRTFIRNDTVSNDRIGGFFWKPDGSIFFYTDYSQDKLYAKHVSTPWNLGTITTTDVSVDLSAAGSLNENLPFDVYFSNDGLKLYILGANQDYVSQYNLSTAWDVTSFSGAADKSLYVGSVESTPVGIEFSTDGTHMYIAGQNGDGIDQFVSS